MTHRLLKVEDRGQVEALWDYCFEKKGTPFFEWFFEESFRYDRTVGSFSEEKLKSMLNLASYTLSLKGREVPVSYIVGVATWPEYRGKGEVKELLKEAFQTMRGWGEYLSILMPSRPEFYYPLDFQIYQQHLRYRIPMEELKNLTTKDVSFVEISERDIPILSDLYEKAYSFYEGRAIRDLQIWKSWLDSTKIESGKAYLIYCDGKPEGYIFYALNGDTLKVSDWAAISHQARAGFIQFCYQHRAQAGYAEWDAPQDDTFQFLLPETKKQLALIPFMTSRIVDIEKLMLLLNWEIEGRFILGIKDSLLEWNNDTFLWETQGEEVVFKRSDESPDLEITIGGLAQWIFGQMDSRMLEQVGFLKIHSKEKAQQLDKQMPRSLTYVNEYF